MPLLVTTGPQSKGNKTSLLRITFIRKLYEAANLYTSDLYVLVTVSLKGVCSHYVGTSPPYALMAEMLY